MMRMNAKKVVLMMMALLSGCGGSSPLGNSPTITNAVQTTNQALSFAYFQRCINPIFLTQLQTQLNGTTVTNTCAAAGCHAAATGAGGALRIVPTAQVQDLTNLANTEAVLRATDMYKNFYSAQGEVVIGSPLLSRLLDKPELNNTLHGGGLIFPAPASDSHVALITYWISHPAPIGQDEFSPATYNMFTPAGDPMSGTCNTQ